MRDYSTILLRVLFLLAALTVGVAPVTADLILFTGFDPGTGPDQPHPNADAAAAAFASAPGNFVQTVDFEAFPIGLFSLTIAPGVGLSGGVIADDPGNTTSGYNTTAGGSRFVASRGSSQVVVTSQEPFLSFGAYVTGAQPGSRTSLTLVITTTTGALAPITLPTSLDGGALFVGFTGVSVIAAVLSPASVISGGARPFISYDTIGLDDVRLGLAPEPSTSQLIIMSLAALALFDFGWRRRKRVR
jgi:hypothetical protein